MLLRGLKVAVGAAVGGGAVAVAVAGYYADQLVTADPHEPLLAPALLPVPFTRSRRTSVWNPATAGSGGASIPLSYDEYHLATITYGGGDRGTTGAAEGAGVGGDRIADGTCVFVAPPSFVSSRSIFLQVAALTADHFVVTETPGYGANAHRAVGKEELTPEVLTAGLERILEDVVAASGGDAAGVASGDSAAAKPVRVIAAGHAAPYAADIARRRPDLVDRLVLLNPTVSGPLPSAQKKPSTSENARSVLSWVMSTAWSLYQVPLLGPGLHFLMQTPANIENQLRTHVFVREESITAEAVKQNQVFARTGTSLPKCAFLVGKCDSDPASFEANLRATSNLALLMGKESRPDTQSAMTLAKATGMPVQATPGALRSFQEFPEETAAALQTLLRQA